MPETPTLTRTLLCMIMNSSAAATVMGKTVLEPSMMMLPLRPESDSCFPQAAKMAKLAKLAEAMVNRRLLNRSGAVIYYLP